MMKKTKEGGRGGKEKNKLYGFALTIRKTMSTLKIFYEKFY